MPEEGVLAVHREGEAHEPGLLHLRAGCPQGAGAWGKELDLFRRDHERHLEVWHGSEEHLLIQPIEGCVESSFAFGLDVDEEPARIEGFVDTVSSEEGRTVVDYKSVGRSPSKSEAEESLQLGIYRIGCEAEAGRLVAFVKHIRQKATVKVSERSVETQAKNSRLLRWLSETIKAWRRCMRTGDWPMCSPQCHWCSESACEYYSTHCYPEKDPTLCEVIQIGKVEPPEVCEKKGWRS